LLIFARGCANSRRGRLIGLIGIKFPQVMGAGYRRLRRSFPNDGQIREKAFLVPHWCQVLKLKSVFCLTDAAAFPMLANQ
jgi:hypothetical protein